MTEVPISGDDMHTGDGFIEVTRDGTVLESSAGVSVIVAGMEMASPLVTVLVIVVTKVSVVPGIEVPGTTDPGNVVPLIVE